MVAANVALPRATAIEYVDVETAAELEPAAVRGVAGADVVLMAAAVADFRPRAPEQSKIAKSGEGAATVTMELEPTDRRPRRACAERRRRARRSSGSRPSTGPAPWSARASKLERKGLDALVVNDVSLQGIGFDADENEVTLVTAGGDPAVPRASKAEVAARDPRRGGSCARPARRDRGTR